MIWVRIWAYTVCNIASLEATKGVLRVASIDGLGLVGNLLCLLLICSSVIMTIKRGCVCVTERERESE